MLIVQVNTRKGYEDLMKMPRVRTRFDLDRGYNLVVTLFEVSGYECKHFSH